MHTSVNPKMMRNNSSEVPNASYTLEDLRALNDQKVFTLLPALVIVGVLIPVGITGNLLVCYVFSCRLKPNTQNFLIICLAVFDLISCIVGMPAEIADMAFYYTFNSAVACKILRFINSFTSFGSAFTLIAIAIDRYRKICRPHSAQMSLYQARISLMLILATTLLFTWPVPIIYGIAHVDVGYSPVKGADCTISDAVNHTIIPLLFNFILLLGFIILTIALVVLYSLILRGLRHHKREIESLKLEMAARSRYRQKKRLNRSKHNEIPRPGGVSASREGGPGLSFSDNSYMGGDLSRSSSQENFATYLSLCHDREWGDGEVMSSPGSGCREHGIFLESSRSVEQIKKFKDNYENSEFFKIPEDISLQKQQSVTSLNSVSSNYALTDANTIRESSDAIFADTNSCNVIYTRVCRAGVNTETEVKATDSAKTRAKNIATKTTTIAFLVTLVFVLSYLPHFTLQVRKFARHVPEDEGAQLVVMNLFIRSYFINSVANIIIYGALNKLFRKEVKMLLHRICFCKT